MSRVSEYRGTLRGLAEWDGYLLERSGLPGPRANLELVQAVADEGTLSQFRDWLSSNAEFLALCGGVGLGRLIADGQDDLLAELRVAAGDRRWRVREGVAMGLQRIGLRSMPRLMYALTDWAEGTCLEKRAVVAGLCEPALVRDPDAARSVLDMLETITMSIADIPERKSDEFRALRQTLAYGWSVALVGNPDAGKPLLEKWLCSEDRDVAWLARENLKKDRLKRMDPSWVERWATR
jgi:hypothetical protein